MKWTYFNHKIIIKKKKYIPVKKLLLTSKKLHAPRCTSDGSGDEFWYAAAHHRGECHQQQKATSNPRHDCTDLPLHAWDTLKACIAPALLQHDRSLPLFIPNWVRTPPESTEGHWLIHLWAQQPVGHEEPHAGSCCTQQGHQSPDHPRTCEAGCHSGEMSLNIAHNSRRELGKEDIRHTKNKNKNSFCLAGKTMSISTQSAPSFCVQSPEKK